MDSVIPDIGTFAFMAAAFIVALSVIVAVHEFGHYIVGRWTGIRADVFSIGFGPVLASRVDRHGTRWQIAALPLGGYVKFRGDANAASAGADAEMIHQMTPQELRETMHGAPLWARAATVAAGPVFNFILAIALFFALLLWMGLPREPVTIERFHAMPVDTGGLREGDVLLEVDGIALADITTENQPEPRPTIPYLVERDGQQIAVEGPWWQPPLVGGVQPDSAGADSGLREGDYIAAIDDEPVFDFAQLSRIVRETDGRELKLSVWREGETLEVSLNPRMTSSPRAEGGFETRYLIGLYSSSLFEAERRTPGVIEAAGLAVERSWLQFTTTISGLAHIVTGRISTCNIAGPLTIAKVSGQTALMGPEQFVTLVAALSIMIGFANLLPIPILDGGHLVFHAWEAVAGRPPPDRVLNVLMVGGLAVLIALMVFAVSNDLFCP